LVSGEAIVRSVGVDPWPSGGIDLAFEATSEECRRLAERFDLVAVARLAGHARLDRQGRVIRLSGSLQADVVQSCVVSLEDVPATIDEAFECRFAQPGAELPDDLAWDQDIEPLEGTELNVGEVFAQQLGVALDPYPHADGAYDLVPGDLGPNIGFEQDESGDKPQDEPQDRPMSALAVAMQKKEQEAARAAPPRQGRE
jgi:hypothetical protein